MADAPGPPSRKGKGTGKKSRPPVVNPEDPAVNIPGSGRGVGVIHDNHAPPPYQSRDSYTDYYPSPPPTRGIIAAPAAPSRHSTSGGQAGPSAPAQVGSQVAGISARKPIPAVTLRGVAMPGACVPATPTQIYPQQGASAAPVHSIPQLGASAAPPQSIPQEASKKKKKKKKKRESGFESLLRTLTSGSKRRHKKKTHN